MLDRNEPDVAPLPCDGAFPLTPNAGRPTASCGGGRIMMLPFAGASSFAFAPILPPIGHSDRLRFRQYMLPGHGERMAEPLLSDLEAIAADLSRTISAAPGPSDVVYGHSMGALLALLLLRGLRASGAPLPKALVVSGMGAPHSVRARARHALPKEALKAELRALGGTPAAVLDDDAVFQFFEPQVRADFRAVETYRHRCEDPLPLPLTVLLGEDDAVDADAARGWQRETVHPIDVEIMPGGHFFIFRHSARVRAILTDALAGPIP